MSPRAPIRSLRALLACAILGAAAPALAQQARLEVANRAGEPIETLQISPSSSNDWGSDLMGRLQLLPGGTLAVNFPANADCNQDVRVTFRGGNQETRMRVDACRTRNLVFDGSGARPAARRSITPEGPSQGRARIVNRSDVMIDVLYVSPSTSRQWGSDLLGRLQLLPGGGVTIPWTAGPDCRQDVRVVFHGGKEETRMGVDLCQTPELVFDGRRARAAAPRPAAP